MGEVAAGTEAALSFSSEGFDGNVYNQVANQASLVEIHLTEANYSAKVPEILKSQYSDDDELKPSYQGEPTSCHFVEDTGWVLGEYTWQADLRLSRKKVLKLKCKYVVIYDGLQGCETEYVHLYFSKVGRFTTYPYFRSQFAFHVSESGLTLPPLPSLIDRVD